MLPSPYHSLYLDFQQALMRLQMQLQQVQENSEAEPAMRSAFQAVQRSFQQLSDSDWEQLDPALAASVQSYQTEINRQFRLLGMDMMYLRAARQSNTANQRQGQVGDRIESLIGYCQALLGSEEMPSDTDTLS